MNTDFSHINTILHDLPEGKERRLAIVNYLKTNLDAKIIINRRYCRQMYQDSDLTKLVKKGILQKNRGGSTRCRTSYLTLKK